MRQPWQCRVLGHDWREQDGDAGERLEFCRRCGAEHRVLTFVGVYPGHSVSRVVVPLATGSTPVATA